MPSKPSLADMAERKKITQPQLAKLWGIATSKVVSWIRTGELPAINAALSISGRPRYLIDLTDIKAFEARRLVCVPKASSKRTVKRSTDQVIKYF